LLLVLSTFLDQYRSPPDSVQQLQVSWKLVSQNPDFTEGCK